MPRTVSPRVGNKTATSRPSLSIACNCDTPSKFLLPASPYFSSKKSWRYLAKAGSSGCRGIGRIFPSTSMPRSRKERLRPLGARSAYFLSMYRCHRSAGSKTCMSESIALKPCLAILLLLVLYGFLTSLTEPRFTETTRRTLRLKRCHSEPQRLGGEESWPNTRPLAVAQGDKNMYRNAVSSLWATGPFITKVTNIYCSFHRRQV